MNTWKNIALLSTGGLLSLSIYAGVALVQADSAGLINACVNNTSGVIRIVDEDDSCRANEHALSWSEGGEGAGLEGLLSSPNGRFSLSFSDEEGLKVTNTETGQRTRLCPGGCLVP